MKEVLEDMGKDGCRNEVPIWHKLNLSIEETAAYSGIGIGKLYEITSQENCPFVLWIGSRRMIKREAFEKYVFKSYSI